MILSLLLVWSGLVKAADIPHYRNIYVSGPPTPETLANFKNQKGATVIDLRSSDELGSCQEPAHVIQAGMRYQKVNLDKDTGLKAEVLADIDQRVKLAGTKPVLLFCRTGNRAAAWLAVHLVRDEHYPLDSALVLARTMGLRADMEAAVRGFFR